MSDHKTKVSTPNASSAASATDSRAAVAPSRSDGMREKRLALFEGLPDASSSPSPSHGGKPGDGGESRSECAGCSGHACMMGIPDQDMPIQGWRLAAAAAGLFVGPLVLALLGALLAGESDHARFLGGLVGLILGLAGSVWLSRRVSRTRKDSTL